MCIPSGTVRLPMSVTVVTPLARARLGTHTNTVADLDVLDRSTDTDSDASNFVAHHLRANC
jgi:hypothetical protein